MYSLKLGDLVYSHGHCGMIVAYGSAGGYCIEWYYSSNYTETYSEFQVTRWRRDYIEWRNNYLQRKESNIYANKSR